MILSQISSVTLACAMLVASNQIPADAAISLADPVPVEVDIGATVTPLADEIAAVPAPIVVSMQTEEVVPMETAPDLVSGPAEGIEAISIVFADKSDTDIVDMVIGYIEGLDTLQGQFTQVAPSGAQSQGDFWLRRPNQMRFEYEEPTPLLIVATQGNVYVRDEAIDQTDLYPVKKTPLRFLLSKEVSLDGAQILSVDRFEDAVSVTFAGEGEDDAGDLTVVFSAPKLALEQWIVRDPQNGATIVSLSNTVRGESIANRLFKAPDEGGAFINN